MLKHHKTPIAQKVVQLGFFPDDPVETFQAPEWGILTKGEAHHAVGAYGPLGPRNVGDVPDSSEGSSNRPRTAWGGCSRLGIAGHQECLGN